MTATGGITAVQVARRRVFYIPGYDPVPARRYREMYRTQGAEQAAISGYHLSLSPGRGRGTYGWQVRATIDGVRVDTEVVMLVWADIVRGSMAQGVAATYLQLAHTAWVYIGSGALFRLMRLRKGPIIAALYPIVMLLAQLGVACLAGAAVGGGWPWRRPIPWPSLPVLSLFHWSCTGFTRRTAVSLPTT